MFFMPWRFSLSAFKDLKNNFKYTNYFFFWVLRMVLNTGIQVIYLLELSHDIIVSSFVFIHLIFDCRRMYCSGPSCLQVSAEGITGVHRHAMLSFLSLPFPSPPAKTSYLTWDFPHIRISNWATLPEPRNTCVLRQHT